MLLLNLLNFFATLYKPYSRLTLLVLLILNLAVFIFIIAFLDTYIRYSYVIADQIVATDTEIRNLEALAKTASEIPVSQPVPVKDDDSSISLITPGLILILFLI